MTVAPGRPQLLDLFCGAGGAAMGYARAGFEVVGVDHKFQRNYPFTFVRADALDWVARYAHEYDVIHASPPCQAYCYLTALHRKTSSHPRLIEPVCAALKKTGLYYVIENVESAPLENAIVLCGSSFGLRVRRHRLFESNVSMLQPLHQHGAQGRSVGVYGHQGSGSLRPREKGGSFIRAKNREDAGDAMGIDWMTWRELTQAIPPAYTQFVGRQIMAACFLKARP